MFWCFVVKVVKLSDVLYRSGRSILKNGKTFFGYKSFFPPFFGNEEKENLLTDLRRKMNTIYRVLVAWQNCVVNAD